MAAPNKGVSFDNNGVGPDYFDPPHSIYGLPNAVRWGMVGVGSHSLVSIVTTLTLLTFLFCRLVSSRKRHRSFLGYSQYVVLLVNLLFADLCLALGFVISFYWVAKNAILAPTPMCAAQGFLQQFGLNASAFFVLAIALHTFLTAGLGMRIANSNFYLATGLTWLVCLFLTVLGLALHKDTYYVRAGAWCWISEVYSAERLGLEVFWILLSEAGVTVLYMVTVFKLRRRTSRLIANPGHASHELANQNTMQSVKRITKLMMLYPLVYLLLATPISAGRMYGMAHGGQSFSDYTQIGAGAVVASAGWANCLLYTLTRKRLMKEIMGGGESSTDGSRSLRSRRRPHAGLHRNDTENGILCTTTVTVHRDSFNATSGNAIPSSLVYTEIWADDRGPRTAEERLVEHPLYQRPPSPERLVMAGFARYGGVVAMPDRFSELRATKHLQRPRGIELKPMAESRG